MSLESNRKRFLRWSLRKFRANHNHRHRIRAVVPWGRVSGYLRIAQGSLSCVVADHGKVEIPAMREAELLVETHGGIVVECMQKGDAALVGNVAHYLAH